MVDIISIVRDRHASCEAAGSSLELSSTEVRALARDLILKAEKAGVSNYNGVNVSKLMALVEGKVSAKSFDLGIGIQYNLVGMG